MNAKPFVNSLGDKIWTLDSYDGRTSVDFAIRSNGEIGVVACTIDGSVHKGYCGYQVYETKTIEDARAVWTMLTTEHAYRPRKTKAQVAATMALIESCNSLPELEAIGKWIHREDEALAFVARCKAVRPAVAA